MLVEFFNNLETRIENARQDEIAFRKMIPQTGFIGDYMKYTDRQESPGSFHFWVAVTILGACIQRRAWISKGMYNVYPNLFTLLVAPSGICRKSKAIDLGIELVEEFPWMNVIADKTTPEALLQALMYGTKALEADTQGQGQAKTLVGEDNTGLIKAGEFVDFVNKQNHNSGLVPMLTNLYDKSVYRYICRNKPPIILKNIAIQLIGGCTPDWFANELPPAAFGGGFMSRFIFMVKGARDRSICFPENPEPLEKQKLQTALLRIRATVTGSIPFEHDARVWFEDWYKKTEYEQVEDSALTGFHERKPDMILKVALILCAAECRKLISLRDVITAHDVVNWTQLRAYAAFKNVDLSPLGQIATVILDFIDNQAGWVSRRTILRKFSRRLPNGLEDLTRIENMLQESGDIKIEASAKSGAVSKQYMRVHRKEQEDAE